VINQIKFYILVLATIFTIGCGATTTLIFHGGSMEPTIVDGQKIKAVPVRLEDLKRGDLIYYVEPVTGKELVKRLIGLPGETVEIKDSLVYINNLALEETYIVNAATYSFSLIALGDDQYFALGDNRNGSADSHTFGPFSGNAIKGIIVE
jgi:signal peptidase I